MSQFDFVLPPGGESSSAKYPATEATSASVIARGSVKLRRRGDSFQAALPPRCRASRHPVRLLRRNLEP